MKKRNVIVYFHGYGSNANTGKVKRLKDRFPEAEVYSFDIDINPDISLSFLEKEIESVLLDDIHSELNLVFVGTSLGAWYAEYLGCLYNASLYLINPSYNPKNSLAKYGVDPNICANYDDMILMSTSHYYIGTLDNVIDYDPIISRINVNVRFLVADHAFAGPEFDVVMDDIALEFK